MEKECPECCREFGNGHDGDCRQEGNNLINPEAKCDNCGHTSHFHPEDYCKLCDCAGLSIDDI